MKKKGLKSTEVSIHKHVLINERVGSVDTSVPRGRANCIRINSVRGDADGLKSKMELDVLVKVEFSVPLFISKIASKLEVNMDFELLSASAKRNV